jgi:hypothetical protein
VDTQVACSPTSLSTWRPVASLVEILFTRWEFNGFKFLLPVNVPNVNQPVDTVRFPVIIWSYFIIFVQNTVSASKKHLVTQWVHCR